MLIDIIVWIAFGALAGWIASIITGMNQRIGALGNIVIGIVGAVIGGWVMRMLGGSGAEGFSVYSLLVAILGAVILLGIARLFMRTERTNRVD